MKIHPGMPGYMSADHISYGSLKAYKLDLIENETKAEKLLWSFLRCKLTGFKIRRQHIIDTYIVDFVCLSKKLIIEVDGGIHNQNIEYDIDRSLILNDLGFEVIRFKNEEVLLDVENVVAKIKRCLLEK
jgi:very-short-patch-repair endonuclease